MRSTFPLRDEASFLELAVALLAEAAPWFTPPTSQAFVAPFRSEGERDGVSVILRRVASSPDPYAGGPTETCELSLESGEGWVRIRLEMLAWVGPELVVVTRGEPRMKKAAEACIRTFLAAFERPAAT
jgi:hypothetical protein